MKLKKGLWTKDEIEILKERYKEGIKPQVIADELGRTRGAVRNKAYNLKITTRLVNYTDEEMKYIIENYDTKNLREIAEDLGRGDNYQNVCRKARELGLTNRNRRKIRHKDRPEPQDRSPKYKNDEERRKASSEFMKEWHKNNVHPRGMLGKTHSKEYRKEISKRTKSNWEDPNHYFNSEEHRQKSSERMSKTMVNRIKKNPKSVYTRARGGTREDLGFYVRSRWEANVARYLKFLEGKGEVFKWEYEPDTFWFENIKRGTRSYTPDFKVWETEGSEPEYWEVKGYMDQKSRTRLKRMAKYYPDIKIKLIMEKEYKAIGEWARLIDNWE